MRPGTPSIGFGKRMPCQWTVVEVIAHHDSERIALPNSEFRAGHRAVVGPNGCVRVAFAGQVDQGQLRGKPVFLDRRIRKATAQRSR